MTPLPSKRSRPSSAIRTWQFETDVNRYAEGSVLVRAGHTHVLCLASIEPKVPDWLAGKGRGWVTAEYSMLPRATHTRSKRERDSKVSGRTHEIQRLIGRALRACVDLRALGERSIQIDCDVLQADGGTRTAAISGACLALAQVIGKLIREQSVPPSVWIDSVAAISVGVPPDPSDGARDKRASSLEPVEREVWIDLDYDEDSSCGVDLNVVETGAGRLIEVQGTAERGSFSHAELTRLLAGAATGLEQVRRLQAPVLAALLGPR